MQSVVSKYQSGEQCPDLLSDLFTAYYCARKNKRTPHLRSDLSATSQIIFNDPVKGCYRKGSIKDWNELPCSKSLFNAYSDCGLPIGNLTSQLFSNIYLSGLDEFVKRKLKVKHYGRYVDDFYIVGNSKEELLGYIPAIREYLSSELGLTLHPHKIHLAPSSKGVRFLGTVLKHHQRYLHPKVVSRAKSRLMEVLTEENNPYLIDSVVQSYSGLAEHFGTLVLHRIMRFRWIY